MLIMVNKRLFLLFSICIGITCFFEAMQPTMVLSKDSNVASKVHTFHLQNQKLDLMVVINRNGIIKYDQVRSEAGWSARFDKQPFEFRTDADFRLNIMWTAWQAPGKNQNADNMIYLTKKDFTLLRGEKKNVSSKEKRIVLIFKGINNPLQVRVIYELDAQNFYIRKNLSVRYPALSDIDAGAFLSRMWPVYGHLLTKGEILKGGGFGQPVAILSDINDSTGAFWGLEYPASDNNARRTPAGINLRCGQAPL